MGQKRYLNFKDAVNSFDTNRKYLGIIPSGRYRGFDTLVAASSLTFVLRHLVTGLVATNEDATTATNPMGVVVTPSGSVINEDAEIPASGAYSNLSIDTNAGNSQTRYDLVICEHEYVDTIGGQAAQYSVIKGALESPVVPALPNSKTQVILGIITIPPGATTLSGVTWTPTPIPNLGNDSLFKLKENNYVERTTGYKVGTIGLGVVGDDVYIHIKADGNTYVLDMNGEFVGNPTVATKLYSGVTPLNSISQIVMDESFPEGSEIKIQIYNLGVTGRSQVKFKNMSSSISDGFLQLVFNLNTDDTLLVNEGAWITLKNLGAFWTMTGLTYGKSINNITESIVPTLNIPGAMWMWPGLAAPTGWLICKGGTIGNGSSGGTELANATALNLFKVLWDNFSNAILPVSGGRGSDAITDFNNNKTITLPDMRSKFPVGYNIGDGDYDALGKTGGEKAHLLTYRESGLRDHSHTAPGTQHNSGVSNDRFYTSDPTDGGLNNNPPTSGVKSVDGTGGRDGNQNALDPHENRPPFFTLNYIIKI